MTSTQPVLRRDSRFGYRCQACGHCCRDKLIRVNPYETLQLAIALGMSTTAFLGEYVDRDTSFLKLRADGRCVFFDDTVGCSVHAHRPLVCRLYPLGRHVHGDGTESFSVLQGHPLSQGQWHGSGTVADFLASQDAARWLSATDRLLDVFHDLLHARAGDGAPPPVQEQVDWLDVDQVLASRGLGRPGDAIDAEQWFEEYLVALRDLIATTSEEASDEPSLA